MKKFQFTLQKLMDFRQQELDRQKNTLSALEVSVRKRYIVSLQQEIHAHDASAAMKQQEINKQLGVVVEATKDVRTLEKLEEKQLEDYRAAANKENEQFISGRDP